MWEGRIGYFESSSASSSWRWSWWDPRPGGGSWGSSRSSQAWLGTDPAPTRWGSQRASPAEGKLGTNEGDAMNRIEEGRSLLRRWEESKPTNFYEDDQHLRRVLAFRVDAARLAPVAPLPHQAGPDAAGPVSRASALLDRPEHLPRLEPWNGIGERTEEIVFPPPSHEVGRVGWGSAG